MRSYLDYFMCMCVTSEGYRFRLFLRFFNWILELSRQCGIVLNFSFYSAICFLFCFFFHFLENKKNYSDFFIIYLWYPNFRGFCR